MPSALAEVLRELAEIFAREGVRWYLFGAQAAILHGAVRLTADVDVTVWMDQRPLAPLLDALARSGFVPRVADPLAFAETTRVLPLRSEKSPLPVDVVLAGPGLEERFLAGAETREVEGVAVPVARAEDVVLMKVLAGRPKDRDDVSSILAARAGNLDLDELRSTLAEIGRALDRDDLVRALDSLLPRVRGR